MLNPKRWGGFLAPLYLALLAAPLPAELEERSTDLFDGFRPGWRGVWMERKLGLRKTRYDVASIGGDVALRATSESSGSALWRRLQVERPEALVLAWRWRVDAGLRGNDRERTKGGDDYPARILVSFGGDALSRKAPTLCYVWAANEPVGSTFRNPYADNVGTIVLQSGEGRNGEWIRERRDALADFRTVFGGHPDSVTAIAVIADTDDTQRTAIAWFDDLRIEQDP